LRRWDSICGTHLPAGSPSKTTRSWVCTVADNLRTISGWLGLNSQPAASQGQNEGATSQSQSHYVQPRCPPGDYNSDPSQLCPPGFTYKEECSWFGSMQDTWCEPPDVENAVVPPANYNIHGGCACNAFDTCPNSTGPVPANCSKGDTEIGYRQTRCSYCWFCGGDGLRGTSYMRSCASNDSSPVWEARNPSDCKGRLTKGLTAFLTPLKWCRPGFNESGNCWLPYVLRSDNTCHAVDHQNIDWFKRNNSAPYGFEFKQGGTEEYLR